MTIDVSDNTPRVSYTVAESVEQTSFTVSFEFFADADLNVYVDSVLKTITTDYTVTGGNGSTGSITMSVTGASGGSAVVIVRSIALERTTDYPTSGPFNIAALNTELDRIIAIAADYDDNTGRNLILADYDTAVDMTIPLLADRASKFLGFDANGLPIASAGSVDTISVSTFMETLLDDTTALAASQTLELEVGVDVQAYDATMLVDADIGVTIQAYDAANLTKAGGTMTGRQTSLTIRDTNYSLTGTVIDAANGDAQYKTLAADTTFTENLSDGDSVELFIDDGAAYTVTWPTITWDDAAPTLLTTGYTRVILEQMNGVVYGSVVVGG